MRKVFVDVYAHFSKDGELTPISFVWIDGKTYEINKIIEKKNAAALKVGGQGIRFKCMVYGKMVNLFYDDGKWFLEI